MKKLSVIFGLVLILGLLATPAFSVISFQFDFDGDKVWDDEAWLTQVGDTLEVELYLDWDYVNAPMQIGATFTYDKNRFAVDEASLYEGCNWYIHYLDPIDGGYEISLATLATCVICDPDPEGKYPLATFVLRALGGDGHISGIKAQYDLEAVSCIDAVEFTPDSVDATIHGPCGVEIDPSSAEVATGKTLQFSASPSGSACEGLPLSTSFTWEITTPEYGSAIDPDTGLYTAGCLVNKSYQEGDTIKVTDNEYGGIATAVVKILGYRITGIEPDVEKVKSDATKKFSATTENCCPVNDNQDFQWSLDPSTSLYPPSTIDPDTGDYKAGINKTGGEVSETIKVEDINNCCDGVCAYKEKTITVKVCTEMDLQPKDPNERIINAGETIKFRDAGGTCCPGVDYTWELTVDEGIGSSLGATGLYRAGREFLSCEPVTETIMLSDACGSSETAFVTVRSYRVEIAPESREVYINDSIWFGATTECKEKNPLYTWSLNSESDTSSGCSIFPLFEGGPIALYIAGPHEGKDIVTVTDSANYMAARTATVTVLGTESTTTTTTVGPTTTTTVGPSTTTTAGPITTTTVGPVTTTTVGPTTTTTAVSTTTTISTTTTTTLSKYIEVSPSEVMRSRWVPLFALMNIKGTGTNFAIFKTPVSYDSTSVLKLPAFVLSPTEIYQIILIMPSILTGMGFNGESETVEVMVDGVSDTFEIKMLPAPLDKEKNLK